MKIKNIKAAILVENHKALVVDEIAIPHELSFGQVLVKIYYSGICGAQINEIDAAKGPDKFLPHLLGHEGSGVVQETGPGVTTVKVEDHVVMHWRPSSGVQSSTPKYSWNGKQVNAGWVTTFNEYAVVSENRLTVIPEDFDLKIAPLLGCAVTSAFGVINNDARVRVGQSVVVFGIGGVGLNIVQAANMVSAYPVVGLDLHDSKLQMAETFGASHTINSSNIDNLEIELSKIVGAAGADVVIDTTGNASVIENAYELTHPDGKTILVGVPKRGDKVSLYTLPLHFKRILTGSHGGDAVPDIDIPRYIRLMRAGKLELEGIITHEFNLNEVNQAIDTIRRGDAGRVLLNMGS